MDVTIRKLTPELAEDYLHFFDTTPHDDGADGCVLCNRLAMTPRR